VYILGSNKGAALHVDIVQPENCWLENKFSTKKESKFKVQFSLVLKISSFEV